MDYETAPGAWDEAFARSGAPRPEARAALDALARHDPALAAGVRAAIDRADIGFSSVDGDADFHLDPVPRVIGAGEWARLEAGLGQRVRALNAFLADAHGERAIVAAGVMPARVIDTCENWEPALRGLRVPGDLWVGIAGLDVVRTAGGELVVLEDNLTTPSGFAYAVAARAVTIAELGVPPADAPRPIDGVGTRWPGRSPPPHRGPLPAGPRSWCSPTARRTPPTGDPRRAGETLGAPVATPADLEVRGDRLRLGGRDVDVVYRRTDEHHLDSHVGELLGGVRPRRDDGGGRARRRGRARPARAPGAVDRHHARGRRAGPGRAGRRCASDRARHRRQRHHRRRRRDAAGTRRPAAGRRRQRRPARRGRAGAPGPAGRRRAGPATGRRRPGRGLRRRQPADRAVGCRGGLRPAEGRLARTRSRSSTPR